MSENNTKENKGPEKIQTGIKLDKELVKFLKSQSPLRGFKYYGEYVNQILWTEMEKTIPELINSKKEKEENIKNDLEIN